MKLSITKQNKASLFTMLIFLATILPFSLGAQSITSDPALPTDASSVKVYFDATGTALEDYEGDVYAHTGVLVEGNTQWQYVIGTWGVNTTQPQLDRLGPNSYVLDITPSIREFYAASPTHVIQKMAFVFRAAAGSPQSADLFLDVYQAGTLSVSIVNPAKDQPIVEFGQNLDVVAAAIGSSSLELFINNQQVVTSTDSLVEYTFDSNTYGYGTHWIKAVAQDDTDSVSDSTYVFVRSQPEVAELPAGVLPGINYVNDSTVTLVLHDPPATKDFVFVIGDFNDWRVTEEGYMNVTPSGNHFWLTLTELTPGEEYGFQYFIDNEIRLADPYTQITLDPWNDQWIADFNYPDLKPYPDTKTTGVVSVIQPGRPQYVWEVTDFTPAAKEDLVIYELLIRDFVGTSAIKTVMDSLDYLQRLGINAIELMPFNEFEGNISWGYNPAFYFATDKAYGTEEDYKAFIDECHKRGIAVIMDMVLNHSFNLSPFVQMYFNPDAGSYGQPSADNPWFLETCPHEPWCWGNTFDQNSTYTHELFNRITQYWLTEFNLDGFRFDFTKGFTNVQTGNQGSNYDAARIDNLKRIADHMWSVKPESLVILEHLTENSEEKELAEYGMMLWGNVTHSYQEASMGWLNDSDFSWASYKNRGWNEPHLISYMESHDEERMVFKNINYGKTVSGYDIKNKKTALQRAELAATFYFTIPGPKMIWQFGELGYDYSINHCQDGTINNDCRTNPKPIRWDYYNDWDRRNLYNVYSILIELKKEQEVFSTSDYTLALGGSNPWKRINLNHESNQVTVLGNFGAEPTTFIPGFQHTGTWYEFFSRETFVVNDLSDPITLQPGEYRIYSTVEFPDHGIALSAPTPFPETSNKVEVYPNPSESGFNFSFNTARTYHLRIVNLQGQVVFEKENAFAPDRATFHWDTRNDKGKKTPAGIYFYSIHSADENLTGKILIN